MESLTVRRLSITTLLMMLATGYVLSLVPFCLCLGVLAQFGAATITWNGNALTGIGALVASPFIGLAIALVLTVLTGLFLAIGLWLFSRFRPLTLAYAPLVGMGP
jgi:hypothetical protein